MCKKEGVMSKGEELRKRFDSASTVSDEMDRLFLRNNLSLLDLNQLPEEDKKRWYELKAINEDLSSQICSIINDKD